MIGGHADPAFDYAAALRRVQDARPREPEAGFGELLGDVWCAEYAAVTRWQAEIAEIPLGRLTYLFDAAPSLRDVPGEDRVVGVWGWSSPPRGARDAGRMAGFVPVPDRWSHRNLDRGHFVSHAAGGGTDLNLFPQVATVNRGQTAAGRRWRAIERAIASRPGTFLFVRPTYDDDSWVPASIDLGYVDGGEVVCTSVANRP